MWRKVCWCLVALMYWAIVVHFLRAASPVFFDGGGPMPSFFWGEMPTPDLAEYYRRRTYYEVLYSVPYILAGLIMTITGCGAALILRRLRPLTPHPFRSTTAITLAILLFLSCASDAGSLLALWRAPIFLLDRHIDVYRILCLSKVFLPASLLSGVLQLANRWMSAIRTD